jgi:uncharacterized protein YbcV (DUF1398 family)
MFHLSDISEAHSKVKSGADFPTYIQDLIKLGVKKYDTYVSDGHTLFFGDNNYQVHSGPKYPELSIANTSDKETFKNDLKSHQRGETDYPTFCNHSAANGVEKWTVDLSKMTCTYFDKAANNILEEQIPTP